MIALMKFNKKYYDDIYAGRKVQTIRKNNLRLAESQKVKAIFPGTDLELTLEITGTGYKQFKYIDDDDAKREGFNTAEELKAEILSIYPRLDDFSRIYAYQFKVC